MSMIYFAVFILSLLSFVTSYGDLSKVVLEEEDNAHEVRDELYRAVFVADVNQVKFLLGLDPEILSSRPPVLVNRVEGSHGRTSLMVCGYDPQQEEIWKVDEDCFEIAKLLHHAGANLTLVDNYGWDALAHGAVRGFRKYCDYLLDQNVPMNRQDQENRTALMKAVAHAQLQTAKLLLQRKADYRLRDKQGLTALHHGVVLALRNASYIPFFDALIHAHPAGSINTLTDKDGRTVLMYAAISNNLAVTKVLLAHQADPSLSDHFHVPTPAMTSLPTLKQLLLDASIVMVEQAHARWMKQQSSAWQQQEEEEQQVVV